MYAETQYSQTVELPPQHLTLPTATAGQVLPPASNTSSCGGYEQQLNGQLSEWPELLMTSEAPRRHRLLAFAFFHETLASSTEHPGVGVSAMCQPCPLRVGANLHFHIAHSGRWLIKNSWYGNTRRASQAPLADERCSRV